MPFWLTLAVSPVFRFALALCVLALLRLLFLLIWDMVIAIRRAGDPDIPYHKILRETVSWLFPVARIHKTRQLYSYASFVFHLGILAGGLFLGNHLDILEANIGLTWPAFSRPVLDILTLATIVSGSFLLLHRIYVISSRKLSNLTDYLLLVLVLSIFLSGYLAGQGWNPFPYDALMLFHTLCGIVLILVIPFTKVTHCVLYPLIRLGSEVAWHFPSRAGSEVIETLYGPESRRI